MPTSGDAKVTRHLVAGNSVLAVDQHPHASHPFIQTEGAILKDRFHLDGELALATLAEPQQAGLDERVFVSPTSWTGDYSARPAQVHGIYESTLRVSEVNYRILKGFGMLHVRHFFALQLYLDACAIMSKLLILSEAREGGSQNRTQGISPIENAGTASKKVCFGLEAANQRMIRSSPTRRVTRSRSRYSSSGIAYLRETANRSLNCGTLSFGVLLLLAMTCRRSPSSASR